MDWEAGDNTVAPAGSSLEGGPDESARQSDHQASDSAPSIPPGMESRPIEPTTSVADRTAAEIFAALKRAGGTVDADAVLEETSPTGLIERADEPVPEFEPSTDLFDEAAFEANIIPDREPDGEFLWIDLPDSASATTDRNARGRVETESNEVDGPELDADQESESGEWAGLSGQPSVTRIEDDHVESRVCSLSNTGDRSAPSAASTPSGEQSGASPAIDQSSATDSSSDRDATDRSTDRDSNPGPGRDRQSITTSATDDSEVDDSVLDDTDESTISTSQSRRSVGWLEANELDVSWIRTHTSASGGQTETQKHAGSTESTPQSAVTDEFDSVSSKGSGRVPTRTDPPQRSNTPTSRETRSTSRDRRERRPPRESEAADVHEAPDSSSADGDESASVDDSDASEVRTTVDSFDRHAQSDPESTAPTNGIRALIGRFRK